MAKLLHENSGEAVNEALDIFSVPPTQVSIERTQTTIVTPNHIGGVIELSVPSLDGYYLDLNNCMLKLICTIYSDDDDTALTAGDKVAFVNNVLDSLFKQVDVYFGSELINSSDNNHAHKSYLYRLLNDTPDVAKNYIESQGWCKDTAKQLNAITAASKGFTERVTWTTGSKDLEIMGKIRHGMFEQPRLLVDGVDVKLKLTRNEDKFCVIRAADKKGVIKIKNVEFHARQVKIVDAVLRAHKQVMLKTPARYPYTSLQMSNHSFAAGVTSIEQKIINGVLPTRIVFGFVKTPAYNGSATTNPYCFENCSITSMSVNVNGHQLNGREYHFDFAKDKYLEGYVGLLNALGKWDNETAFDINRDEYGDGFTLFGFDLTPDKTHGCFQLERSGTVSLTIKCTVPAGGVTLLLLKEYQKLLQIDYKRKVYL